MEVGQLFMCVVRALAHLIKNRFGVANTETNIYSNTNTVSQIELCVCMCVVYALTLLIKNM